MSTNTVRRRKPPSELAIRLCNRTDPLCHHHNRNGDHRGSLEFSNCQTIRRDPAGSLSFYRFWIDIGQTYYQTPPDQIFDAIWSNRAGTGLIGPGHTYSKLFRSTARLIVRLASDAESDHILASYTSGLQSRLCAGSLREFFSNNLTVVCHGGKIKDGFYADVNHIAIWANLGYVEEATIRNHILQSLISNPELYDHHVEALIILFKLAGATFEAHADPSVVDCCFERLKSHYIIDPVRGGIDTRACPRVTKGSHRAKTNFQGVVALRKRGWEGLPPPPVFTTEKPESTSMDQEDPTATPVATSPGLPNRDPEPQIPQSPPPKSSTSPEADTIPTSPITKSPFIGITTLFDFVTADPSDDELPIDTTAATPHETFYLDDGNVEVLCGNTLFRVHTSTLSFHSPTLRRMPSQASLAMAESPNGCPRIPSSDTPKDFATLLKVIYFPGSVALSAYCCADPLTIYLQIPRTEWSAGFRHIFVPPPNYGQVRDSARSPISVT